MFSKEMVEAANEIIDEKDKPVKVIDEEQEEEIEEKSEAILEDDVEEEEEEDIFIKPKTPEPVVLNKKGKPKRKLTEAQLANLAKAREKGLLKRKALAIAKKKDAEIKKLEKTKHIRARKAKAIEQEAMIAAMATDEVEQKEKAEWDEERLVSLMNRTMDTYYNKRQEEKKKRATIPLDPAQQGYYIPAQAPPMRHQQQAPPQPQAPSSRQDPSHPQFNPYFKQFGIH